MVYHPRKKYIFFLLLCQLSFYLKEKKKKIRVILDAWVLCNIREHIKNGKQGEKRNKVRNKNIIKSQKKKKKSCEKIHAERISLVDLNNMRRNYDLAEIVNT